MQGINRLFFLAAIVHVACFGAGLYLGNALSETPNYGGFTGFLPATGGGDSLSDPEQGGAFKFLRWILSSDGPVCGTVTITKMLIGMVFLEYEVINLLPVDGFGNWFRLAIHLIGAAINITLIGILVRFAVQAGIFNNPQLLVLIGVISLFGFSATLLNAGGLICG